MKALVQRVMNAKVTVNDEVISSIGQGLCVFVGISTTDNVKDMEYIANKILSVKLFEDEHNKKWKMNVVEKQFEILCVSQFTLYNTWKGNKPDFHYAMPGEKSKDFYEQFIQLLEKQYIPEKVKAPSEKSGIDGRFGAYMQVTVQNDGPVTVEIESPTNMSSKAPKGRGRGDAKDNAQNSKACEGEEETKV